MKVIVPVVDGYLAEKYSKYADDEFLKDGVPVVSFPINISDLPKETKSIALDLVDYDAIPVCGFAWIHWSMINIPIEKTDIPENYSQKNPDALPQGRNSSGSKLVGAVDKKIINRYNGPQPPDKDHEYTLTVYALNTIIDLEDGFFLNDFYKKINNHILEKSVVTLKGKA